MFTKLLKECVADPVLPIGIFTLIKIQYQGKVFSMSGCVSLVCFVVVFILVNYCIHEKKGKKNCLASCNQICGPKGWLVRANNKLSW